MRDAHSLRFQMAVAFRAVSSPSIHTVHSPVRFPVDAVLTQPREWFTFTEVIRPPESGLQLVASLRRLLCIHLSFPVGCDMLLPIFADGENDQMCSINCLSDLFCVFYRYRIHSQMYLINCPLFLGCEINFRASPIASQYKTYAPLVPQLPARVYVYLD